MEKVTTINLAGNAFQIEDVGFAKLSSYLAEARAKLAGNPDLEEIMIDFEQALAQKCRARLSSHKTVISNDDVADILNEMGPVETEESDAHTKNQSSAQGAAPRKLYRIREGAVIAGVCNGLAAYFNVDVTLVRIAFVILAILSSGVWILAYVVMALIIPAADTPQEHSAAYGAAPVTAQNLLDRAKTGYEDFKNSQEWAEWRKNMHEESQRWKRQWKAEMQHQKQHNEYYQGYTYTRSPFWEFMHSLLGMVWTLLIIAGLWYAYHNSLIAKEYMDMVGTFIQHMTERVIAHFQK